MRKFLKKLGLDKLVCEHELKPEPRYGNVSAGFIGNSGDIYDRTQEITIRLDYECKKCGDTISMIKETNIDADRSYEDDWKLYMPKTESEWKEWKVGKLPIR